MYRNRGFDRGFNRGFDRGFDRGFNRGFNRGSGYNALRPGLEVAPECATAALVTGGISSLSISLSNLSRLVDHITGAVKMPNAGMPQIPYTRRLSVSVCVGGESPRNQLRECHKASFFVDRQKDWCVHKSGPLYMGRPPHAPASPDHPHQALKPRVRVQTSN